MPGRRTASAIVRPVTFSVATTTTCPPSVTGPRCGVSTGFDNVVTKTAAIMTNLPDCLILFPFLRRGQTRRVESSSENFIRTRDPRPSSESVAVAEDPSRVTRTPARVMDVTSIE
jgi:hypothetical protein